MKIYRLPSAVAWFLTGQQDYLPRCCGPKHFGNAYPSDDVNAFFDAYPEDSIRQLYTIVRPGDHWGAWDTAAYDANNRVRTRAGVSSLPEGLSQEEFFEALKDERRLEMTFELTRYFDLIRWGEGEEMPGFNPARNQFFPLLQTELDLNPNLEQNPGW